VAEGVGVCLCAGCGTLIEQQILSHPREALGSGRGRAGQDERLREISHTTHPPHTPCSRSFSPSLTLSLSRPLFPILQERTSPKFGYMEHQPQINEKMRCILIDWLVEVHAERE
jgi:hypothetical protein